MIEIRNWEVAFLERSIIASGNPMTIGEIDTRYIVGDKESEEKYNQGLNRARNLGRAMQGSGHDNFLCGIQVMFDIKFPQYWTPESQRYHWWNIVSSQSKMHRLTVMGKDEHFADMFTKYTGDESIRIAQEYINLYNFLQIDSSLISSDVKYQAFINALSNLPLGFEMWETVNLSYLQIKTIVSQRKNHRLCEDWGEFCRWAVEDLPMFRELTGLTL